MATATEKLLQLVWSRGALCAVEDDAMVQRVALLEDNVALSPRIQARLLGLKPGEVSDVALGPKSVAMLWMNELGRGVLTEDEDEDEDGGGAGKSEEASGGEVVDRGGSKGGAGEEGVLSEVAEVQEVASAAAASAAAASSPSVAAAPSLLQSCPWYTNGNAYCGSSSLALYS